MIMTNFAAAQGSATTSNGFVKNGGNISEKIKELQTGTTCSETIEKDGIHTFCRDKKSGKNGLISFYPSRNETSVLIRDREKHSYYSDDNNDGKIDYVHKDLVARFNLFGRY